MQYALIMYEAPTDFEARAGEKQEAYWGAWGAYAAALSEAGVMRGGQGLLPPQMSTTLRLNEGKRHVQDGPFADTREQLGGFFVIDVPSLDEALTWAARSPAASGGAVEVRPVLVIP